MDIVWNIVIGIATGVLASLLFFLLSWSIKPKLKISNKVCGVRIKNSYGTESNSYKYKIKVVNLNHVPLKNVHYILEIRHILDDNNIETEPIKFSLEPTHILYKYSKKDKYSQYAFRISFTADILNKMNNDSDVLVFTIFAEHSITSTGIVKVVEYKTSDILQNKHFEQGKSIKYNSVD